MSNNQFDEVEIRAFSCFRRCADEIGMPAAVRDTTCAWRNSGPAQRNDFAKLPLTYLAEFRSICGSAIVMTHSCTPSGHPGAER
jgi:hypothetical protein